jgi:D-sedoheptulose 7-phosphate isomerase
MLSKINYFIKNYTERYIKLLLFNEEIYGKISLIIELLNKTKTNKKKIIIFGNGGSAAIASHFSVDLTKNANIRCVNFNESDLLTCFSNDYGYDNWVKKSIEFYSDPGDLIILISSSGNSKNMINAAKYISINNKNKLITLTGFEKKNQLNKFGNINIWINSKNYNYVENMHQFILLLIVDALVFFKK